MFSRLERGKIVKTFAAGLLTGLFLLAVQPALSQQGYAGEGATMEPTMLIDKPTAGMLKRAGFLGGLTMYQSGGVLSYISVGVWDRFMFGISYGGTNILGQQRTRMNPLPGVNIKIRIIEESRELPAVAIGFDSQGRDAYSDSPERYSIKSPGLFAAASKNYSFMGYLSFHGGVNLSLERNDGDKDLNLYAGLEKSAGSNVSLLLEYDFAANDNHGEAFGRGRGYLNFGLRISIGSGLVLGINLKDLFQNQPGVTFANRTVQLDYTGVF
jgi:hypothetical protein